MNIIELCLLLPQFGHTVVVLQRHLPGSFPTC